MSCAIAPTSITAHCAFASRLMPVSNKSATRTIAGSVLRIGISLLIAPLTPDVFARPHEQRQPLRGIRAGPLHDRVEPLDRTRSPRDHRKLACETFEIELANDRVMPLLHEEHA